MGGTLHRGAKGARVVITLDIEITDEALRAQPNWARTCSAALRELITADNVSSPSKLIAWLRRSRSFTVLDEKIEVAP